MSTEDGNDLYDDMLEFAAAFNWMDPVADLLRGFNTIEHEGSETRCKEIERQLKKQGIPCRKYFTGDSWRVISRR